MRPPDDLTEALDPGKLAELLLTVHGQVVAALWLSAGMLCAFSSLACLALGWRRPALAAGLGYSVTLCFLSNGHAQLLGPAGCAIALAGFLWPRRKSAGERRGDRP